VSGKKQVELKGGMYTFMSLKLHTADLGVIDKQIADKVQQAPGFFNNSPVVVDLCGLESELADGESFDTAELIARIRKHKLLPIVASVADKSSPFAARIALPLLESGTKRQHNDAKAEKAAGSGSLEKTELESKPESSKSADRAGNGDQAQAGAESKADAETAETAETAEEIAQDIAIAKEVEVLVKSPMLVTRPVRSGQQVYSRDTDLIITGSVGAGAEVLADQNIHVYGPLRGRALCGVSGSTSARIFCQSLEAELVSVAGNFRVLEEIPAELRGKPAQIWLDKDRLNIEPLVDTNLSGVLA